MFIPKCKIKLGIYKKIDRYTLETALFYLFFKMRLLVFNELFSGICFWGYYTIFL